MKTHTEEKPFECNNCDSHFDNADALNEHSKSHTNEKPSDADINKLVSDARSDYENENQCTECPFKSQIKDEMINHLITHNIYACDKCDYRSNTSNGLKGHTKKHNDKKFKCDKCDFKGTSLIALSNHMRNHTGDEICLSPNENEIKSSQSSKRGLSVSPEKI